MKYFGKFGQFGFAVLISTSIGASALAESGNNSEDQIAAGNNWVHNTLNETAEARKARGGRTYVPADWVYTSASDSTGAAFVCANKKLSLILSTKPQDISTLFNGQNNGRSVTRPVSLIINDEIVSREAWTVRPRKGLASSKNKKTTRKLYNAAIRGDKVALMRKTGGSKVQITLPKVNGEFAKFGGSCGIGNNK